MMLPNDLFRCALGAVKDYSIFIIDKQGNIVFANKESKLVYAYNPEEILSLTFQTLFAAPEIRDGLPDLLIRETLLNGEVAIDCRHRKKDGSEINVSIRLEILANNPHEVEGLIVFSNLLNTPSLAKKDVISGSPDNAAELDCDDFETLIHNTKDLIWSIDRNYHLSASNKAFNNRVNHILGHSLPMGSSVWNSACSEKQVADYKGLYDRVFLGESIVVKEYNEMPEPVWSELTINPIVKDNVVIGASCYSHDITEIKLAKERIKTAKANLNAIIENSSEILILTDAFRTIISCNSNANNAAIFNSEIKMEPGGDILNSIHEARKDLIKEMLHQVVQFGSSFKYEISVNDRSGQLLWYEMSLNPVKEKGVIKGICLNGRDITPEKKARDVTINNEKRYRALVENGKDAIVIFSAEMKPIYTSPSLANILGYSETEAMQLDLFQVLHPDDFEVVKQKLDKVFANPGKPFSVHAIRILHKNGTWRYIDCTTSNFLDDPAIAGIVDNFNDITDKVLRDQEIKNNREQLQKIVDNSLDVICTLDKKGNFINVSKSSINIWGYEPEELIGTQSLDLIITDDRPTTQQMTRSIMRAESVADFENRIIRKDGRVLTMNWSAKWNAVESTFFVIARDTTARKKLEIQLVEEKKRYAELFLAAPSSICILRGERLVYEMANPLYLELTGKYDIIGKTAEEVFPELVDQGFLDLLYNVYRTGIPFAANEFPIRLEINGIFVEHYMNFVYQPFKNSEGVVDGIFFFANMVTEQVMARKQIEQKEKHFRALVENAGDVILLLDKDGKISYLSPGFEKLTGFSCSEMEGNTLQAIVHPDSIEETSVFFKNLIDNPGIHFKRLNRWLCKNGDSVWVEGVIVNMLDDENVRGVVGNLRDITERKLADEKLVNANRLYVFISNINQAIVHAANEQTVFEDACQIANDVGNFSMCWIGLFSDKVDTIDLVASSGMSKELDSYFAGLVYEDDDPQYHVLKTGSYYLCNDIPRYFKPDKWNSLIEKHKLNSLMVLPVRKYGAIIGTINLYSTVLNLFDKEEIALLNEVANDISFALDIFENDKYRKLMEKKVAHSELHLKQAQAIAHFGSWERNLITDVVVWSEETCKIHGVDFQQNILTFNDWISFIHPDDVDTVLMMIKESDASLISGTFQHRIIRPDGTIRHLQSHFHFELSKDDTPLGVYGVARDITETRLAELALAQSEANLRLIMDLLPQAIFAKNVAGKFVFMNKNFASLFGYVPGELIGKSPLDIKQLQAEVDEFISEDNEVLLTGETKIIQEQPITDFNGRSRLFHTIKVPFTIPGINEKAILGITNDITEQKQAEQERAKMIADIIQRNKDLEQFSYIVSHNMRAPLANILGLAEVMEISGIDRPEEKELMDGMRVSVRRLDDVIKDLNFILQVKHTESKKKEIINLPDLIDEIKLSINNLIRLDGVEINSDFTQVDKLHTFKTYIYSIFFNLISNSIKYRRPDMNPVINIRSYLINDKIRIVFKDNGLGMDLVKNSAYIFGLYKRFHNHVEGKGLGLYMVKSQVEALGGSISVESKVNEGIQFTLEFERD